jgi:steroid delta-isomerase-like uncharacterized protein
MTPEEMRAALTKMLDDFWHKEDIEAAYAIYSDDVVFQRIPFPPMVGKAANMQADAGTLAAFSENHTTVDEIIIEGDAAVVRWSWEATHSGVSPSLGIPPTGKRVGIVGCSVFHFKNGKIVEQWEYSDMLGLLQQLGVIPALG